MNKIIKILSMLILFIFFVFNISLSESSNSNLDKVFKKIDIIYEKNPENLNILKNKILKLSEKYSNNKKNVLILKEIIDYIDKKQSNLEKENLNEYKLLGIIDWDTISVEYDWKKTNIRMIWLDAPEKSSLRFWSPECFGKESYEQLSFYLSWATMVSLEFDESQGKTDKYNRLLAYVLYNWENVNWKMIKDWYAFEYTYNKKYKYQENFKKNQEVAKNNSLWLWSNETCSWLRDINKLKTDTSKKINDLINDSNNLDGWKTIIIPGENMNCVKKTCSQITNCFEAYYQLNTCWNISLDRDRDWVPCESICK